jgi:hypothetical protein
MPPRPAASCVTHSDNFTGISAQLAGCFGATLLWLTRTKHTGSGLNHTSPDTLRHHLSDEFVLWYENLLSARQCHGRIQQSHCGGMKVGYGMGGGGAGWPLRRYQV